MLKYNARWTMTRCAVASLALHASLIVPVVLFMYELPKTRKTETLLVELYGLIANRQVEAQEPPVQPPPRPLAQERDVSSARRPTQAAAQRSPDATGSPPVSVAVESTQATANAQTAEPAGTPSDEPQVQTTLDATDREKDSLRKYLAILKKRLQAKLIYPEEAKRIGYEGTAVLKFAITEEGTIRRGTLAVLQSSGDDDLDTAALEAARASEPFDAPPREMEVVIAVAFELRR